MSTAEKFEKAFEAIPRLESGFRDRRALANWLQLVRSESVGVRHPMGRDSVDPTERHGFADGSELSVANPEQVSFDAFVYDVTSAR